MKIGLVRRGHSATGGAEAYLLRFAAEASRRGHEPVLITTPGWPKDRWPFGPMITLPARSPVEFATNFSRTQTGCDLHLSLERVPGCEVYRAGDGVHAAWLERRNAFEPWWKTATRFFNRKHAQLVKLERAVFDPVGTRAVIANSEMVRREITQHFAFPVERISVIYNGLQPIAALPPREVAREKLGLPPTEFCVLFVGSGWERKGLAVAVEAIDMTENCRLLVAGRGPADLYAGPHVQFFGPVSDLAPLFAAADLFLLPTWYDPFSNACLEALSAGLPVITTTANGFSEIIQSGVHGDVVEPGDALAIAEAIDRWKARLPGDAAAACRLAAGGFSIERNVTETLAVLESVSSNATTPHPRR